MISTQDLYHNAITFAAGKHHGQNLPGTNYPYVIHLSNVAMEIMMAYSDSGNFDLNFAIQVALLHDTIEDTHTTLEELAVSFGVDIAQAVSALSKNKEIPKGNRMKDCLERIKELQKEVWAVKLADRITNLQPPPSHWDKPKKSLYLNESVFILKELKNGNKYLAERLASMIANYSNYIY